MFPEWKILAKTNGGKQGHLSTGRSGRGVNLAVKASLKDGAGQKSTCFDTTAEFMDDKMSYAEVGASITLLYADPANVPLPMIEILQVAIMRAKGASPKKVEAQLSQAREVYSKIH